MHRWTIMLLLAAGGLAAVAPGRADAQVAVRAEIYWTWGDDGWRPHRPAYAPRRPAPAPRAGTVAYPAARRSIRVPPGHLPPILREVIALARSHFRKEEGAAFPVAERLFDPPRLREMGAAWGVRRDVRLQGDRER